MTMREKLASVLQACRGAATFTPAHAAAAVEEIIALMPRRTAWVLLWRNTAYGDMYWTGLGRQFSTSIAEAVQLQRQRDAQTILDDNLLLSVAEPHEVEFPDGDEPRRESVADQRGADGAEA